MEDDSFIDDITTAASQSSNSDVEEEEEAAATNDGISLVASERSSPPSHHPAHTQIQPLLALGEDLVPHAAMEDAVNQSGASAVESTTLKPATSRLNLLDLPLDILREILKEVQ